MALQPGYTHQVFNCNNKNSHCEYTSFIKEMRQQLQYKTMLQHFYDELVAKYYT